MAEERRQRVPAAWRLSVTEALRVLAAAWIVLYYAVERSPGGSSLADRYASLVESIGSFRLTHAPVELGGLIAHAGYQGIPLFFLLTAFSATREAARSDTSLVSQWSRVARILVLYWIGFAVVLGAIALLAWLRHVADGAAFTREFADNTFRADRLLHLDWGTVLAGVTIVPRGLSADWYAAPPFALAIVLPLLQFLLAFPLLFALMRKLGPPVFLAAALAVTFWASALLGLTHRGSGLAAYWWVDRAWLPFHLFTFAAGMALAHLLVQDAPAVGSFVRRWFHVALLVAVGFAAHTAGSLTVHRSSIFEVAAGPLVTLGLFLIVVPVLVRVSPTDESGVPRRAWLAAPVSLCLLVASDPLFLVYGTLRVRLAPAWQTAMFWIAFVPALFALTWLVARLLGALADDRALRRIREPRRAAVAIVLVVILAGTVAVVRAEPFASSTPFPFLVERPAAPLASTQICQLLGADRGGARIRGQDGGTTNVVDGAMYWTFGDSLLEENLAVPNNVAYSTDFEPDDCISLTHKRDERGFAAPLLEKEPGEVTVWAAAGQVSVSDGTVYFLFNSMAEADLSSGTFDTLGIGLGKFDTRDLDGTRVIDRLIDPAGIHSAVTSSAPISAVDMLLHDGYVYVYFSVGTNVRVGRVPTAQIEEKSAYRYWTGSDWVARIGDSVDILRTRGGEQAFNVDFSPLVGKWMGVYATNTLTAVAVAYADAPEGPFTDETLLFDCPQLFPNRDIPRPLVSPQYADRYFCYHATQHPELDRNDRQTIYLTYANLSAYTLYLHRLLLALPHYQWEGPDGEIVYRRSDIAPDGYQRDGVAFYAASRPDDALTPIYDWYEASTRDHRYEAASPGGEFQRLSVAFYANSSPAEDLVPVYAWMRDGRATVYSTFDLSPRGYRRAGAASFYTKTLDAQPLLDTKLGFVYYVHIKGESDSGCCNVTNNPSAQTHDRAMEFRLRTSPDPRGYEGVVCSPVCGTAGRVVWKGDVHFAAGSKRLTLTPNGQSDP